MYRIERKDGKIIIFDNNNKPVYNATDDSWIITRSGGASASAQAIQIGKLTDHQLLTALSSAVKLPMDQE